MEYAGETVGPLLVVHNACYPLTDRIEFSVASGSTVAPTNELYIYDYR